MSITSTRPGEPALRTVTKLGDNAVGRLLDLRPATTGYTVDRVEIPMGDGVRLVADHYAPTTTSPVGTVLVRGPYGRGFPFIAAVRPAVCVAWLSRRIAKRAWDFRVSGGIRADGSRSRRRG